MKYGHIGLKSQINTNNIYKLFFLRIITLPILIINLLIEFIVLLLLYLHAILTCVCGLFIKGLLTHLYVDYDSRRAIVYNEEER